MEAQVLLAGEVGVQGRVRGAGGAVGSARCSVAGRRRRDRRRRGRACACGDQRGTGSSGGSTRVGGVGSSAARPGGPGLRGRSDVDRRGPGRADGVGRRRAACYVGRKIDTELRDAVEAALDGRGRWLVVVVGARRSASPARCSRRCAGVPGLASWIWLPRWTVMRCGRCSTPDRVWERELCMACCGWMTLSRFSTRA